MKKVTTLELADYFQLPNPGLMAYLRHVETGRNEDIRPPFWKGKSRKEVLDSWHEKLEALDVDSKMPGLMSFELEMKGKVGPLSIQLPLADRLSSIEEYYTDVELPSEPIDPRAIAAFKKHVHGVFVNPWSELNTVKEMRLSTNSGAPYFTRRRKIAYESLTTKPSLSLPAVLGWRGQEGGPEDDDVKQRVVWMFPFYTNVQELTMYKPLIDAWQRRSLNSAYVSNRAVEVKITQLFATKGDDYVVVTDFSRFDQHFNSDLQNAAREIIEYQIQPRHRQWLETVFPIKYNIPLLCSPNLMYEGPHGMGSGSGGTNFDECCAHGAMQHEVAIRKSAELNPYSNAYGDDGYLSYKGIDVDDVISAYTSHGQVMNPDKQTADKHSMVYLRRYYHDSYRDEHGIMLGVYSTFRALGRLLGQERYIPFDEGTNDYARYLILRALSIVENCANSPVFYEFVDFVVSGDKYGLGLYLPDFLRDIRKNAREIIEMDPNILGYTKTLQTRGDSVRGIQDWKVVRYLMSKM